MIVINNIFFSLSAKTPVYTTLTDPFAEVLFEANYPCVN